jgi:hypothetical protein
MKNASQCTTPTAPMQLLSPSACALLAVSLTLSGCGSLRLHSDTRQKQGEAAASAWKEVDLKAVFAAERLNQAKLLDAEIQSWNNQFATAHENEIRRLASLQVSQYRKQYDALLTRLVGSVADDKRRADVLKSLGEAKRALGVERDAQDSLVRAMSFLQSGGAQKFTCEQLTARDQEVVGGWKAKNPDLAKSADVVGGINAARADCTKISQAQSNYLVAIDSFHVGEIWERADAWKQAHIRLLAIQAQVDAATISLNAAQAAYDTEVANLKKGKSTVEMVKDKADDLSSALAALEGVQGVFGVEIATEERIKRIDDLLASLKSGEPLDTDSASRLEVAMSMFPKIKDDLGAIKQAKNGRAAVPLLLQRDIEQAKLNAAAAEVARKKQDIELLSGMVEATVRQADSVKTANDHLQRVPMTSAGDQLSVVFSKLNPNEKRELLESTVYYFDAFSRRRALIQAMEMRRRGLVYDTSTDLSEVNASVWSALINATVTQAAEFSSLGIKADDIDKILGLIGLFYIGHGVNK